MRKKLNDLKDRLIAVLVLLLLSGVCPGLSGLRSSEVNDAGHHNKDIWWQQKVLRRKSLDFQNTTENTSFCHFLFLMGHLFLFDCYIVMLTLKKSLIKKHVYYVMPGIAFFLLTYISILHTSFVHDISTCIGSHLSCWICDKGAHRYLQISVLQRLALMGVFWRGGHPPVRTQWCSRVSVRTSACQNNTSYLSQVEQKNKLVVWSSYPKGEAQFVPPPLPLLHLNFIGRRGYLAAANPA